MTATSSSPTNLNRNSPGKSRALHRRTATTSEILEEENTAITEIWHQDSLVTTFRSVERRIRAVADKSGALWGFIHPWVGAGALALGFIALLSYSAPFDSVEPSQASPSDPRAGYLFIDLDEVPEVTHLGTLTSDSSQEELPEKIQDPEVTTWEELPLEGADVVFDLATIEALDEQEPELKTQERTRRVRAFQRPPLRKSRPSSRSLSASPPARNASTGTTKIQLDSSDPWAD